VLSRETKEAFSDMDFDELVSRATKNQVVHVTNTPTNIDFVNTQSIIDYIAQNGHNYNEVD